MNKVIIIGVGNIGKRHLQAVVNSTNIDKIICYDLFKETTESILTFCETNNISDSRITLLYKEEEVLEQTNKESIVIIATTAKNRLPLFESIISKKPKAIIVEKPVVQNSYEFGLLKEWINQNNIPVYVNFIAHAQPFYQKIKEEVSSSNELTFYTSMPLWGLSTVGIHQIELFLWLTGGVTFKASYGKWFKTYEQKRKGFHDIAGIINIDLENGKFATINSKLNPDGVSSINIISDTKSYTILENLDTLITVDKENGVKIEPLNVRFVSMYMNEVVDSIIDGERIILPSIQESEASHKILFEYVESLNVKELNIT